LDQRYLNGPGAVSTISAKVNAIAVSREGGILIGGEFNQFDGIPRTRVARLLANGAVDPTFDPQEGPNGIVYAMAEPSDGRIVIGGAFTSVSGHPRNYLARLNADGSLDESFTPNLPSGVFGIGAADVRAVLVQPDGRILPRWYRVLHGAPPGRWHHRP
jgi:hypothetical protein